MGAMPHHRFKVGQTVVAPSGVRDALIPPGPYVIVRLLPPVGSEPHYRVKSAVDGHERALLEGQMRPVLAEPEAEVERAPAAKPTPVVRHRVVAKPASKRLAGSGGARRVRQPPTTGGIAHRRFAEPCDHAGNNQAPRTVTAVTITKFAATIAQRRLRCSRSRMASMAGSMT